MACCDGCAPMEIQVTIQYLQQADGSGEPQKIYTVVISTHLAGPLKAARCKEVAVVLLSMPLALRSPCLSLW